jgi:hypothetical protein
MWKNTVERGRPQMNNGAGALVLDTYGYRYTHTHKLCNNHCFSTAAIVARTRLNVRLYVHCQSCFKYTGTRTRLYSKRTFPYKTIQWNLSNKETARGRIPFSYAGELRLMQVLGVWILWTPDPWDCKSYPLKTVFRYAQIPVTTCFLY